MAIVKLFPSPRNPNPNGDVWPLRDYALYLLAIHDGLPKDERGSATIRGVDGNVAEYTHLRNQSEVDQERMLLLLDALRDAKTRGRPLTQREQEELLDRAEKVEP